MKKIKKDEKISPEFLEPTDSQIYKTRQAVINKYGVELPHEDAIRFARLVNELSWWIDIENDPDTTDKIVDEVTDNCKEIAQKDYDKKITNEESADCARVLLGTVAEKEKQRIGKEMTAIIESNTKT